MESAVERQQEIWAKQQEWQSQLWIEALEKLQERFEANDADRERRLTQLLETMTKQHTEHRSHLEHSVAQITTVRADFSKLVESLDGIASGERELVAVQASLADNLRILRETQQIDQALHGLTAAIHLLTARNQPTILKESRAA
jgi:monomeric isocitrate dehydrogenase